MDDRGEGKDDGPDDRRDLEGGPAMNPLIPLPSRSKRRRRGVVLGPVEELLERLRKQAQPEPREGRHLRSVRR